MTATEKLKSLSNLQGLIIRKSKLYYTSDKCPSVGSGVIAAVTMMSTIFWDVTPCSPAEVYEHVRGTYCFHLQGQGAYHHTS
jgi:hypothetical protein